MTSLSRRRFLVAVATTASVGVASGQAKTFEFGGQVSGWQGRSPDAIADETNPTLYLTAGTTYVVSWTNLDGEPHTFAIADGEGNVLEETEVVEETGAVQTLEFTATPKMATYFSQVNPETMRGDVVVRQPTTTGTANRTTNETTGTTTTNRTVATTRTAGSTATSTASTTSTTTGGTGTSGVSTATTNTPGGTGNDDGQPGFALLGALGGLGALVYLLWRRGR